MKVFVHREARPWVPSEADLAQIRSFFGERLPGGQIYLWPRRLVDQVYGKPTKPLSFRAFTRAGRSNVFVDPSETDASVAFLMAHELCHQVVDRSPTLSMAFSDAKPAGVDRAGDEFHSVDAEERFCDGIANRLLGTRYDRSWWRRRLEAERFGDLFSFEL